LIEEFLPSDGIAIAAGDSTIGKSPLVMQLALSVAAGVPFLGKATRKGCVLYFDLENSLHDSKAMRDALVQFLSLAETPESFLLATDPHDLEGLIAEVKPQLVLIDSLRAFRPDVTEKNAKAGDWLKEIRRLARKYGCAFLIVHHLRKPSEDAGLRALESCSVANWLLEMEGPRAFLNQTDVRIAIAESDSESVALRVKWSRRICGDSPLVLLERVRGEDGEPAGYRQLTGEALLSPERRSALEKLPAEFSFKEAKAALDRSDDPSNKFLAACRQLGVVEKLGRGRYRKLRPDASVLAAAIERVAPRGDERHATAA
jgi:hypothetical protein